MQKPSSLAIVPAQQSSALEPTNMGELTSLAKQAAETGFYGAKTQQQALLIMMSGRDLGMSYTQALRNFYVVQGRPALSSQGMVAVCLRSGLCEYFRTIEASDTVATVETKRQGDPARRISFTIEEARRAGLANKETWKAYPSRMLLARAQSFAAREVYPDLLAGLYEQDEIPEPSPRQPQVEIVAETIPAPAPSLLSLDEWIEAITEAATLAQLAEIGADIKRMQLEPADREQLRLAYEARRAALKATPPPPSTREPGEDG